MYFSKSVCQFFDFDGRLLCLQMFITLIIVLDTHVTLNLFSFLDPGKLDIVGNIDLNEALRSTDPVTNLIIQKHLLSKLIEALTPDLSALSSRVGMLNPFKKA